MRTSWIKPLLAGCSIVALLTVPAGTASAGGGCHETSQTVGSGSTVSIRDACFTPTILRAKPDSDVAFRNLDPFDHNVYGSGWSIGELPGRTGAHVHFDDAGLYPFACTLHPGMSGVIVVGDGVGAGNGTTVAVGAPPTDGADDSSAEVVPVEATAKASRWIPAGGAGLVLGAAIGAAIAAAVARRRRQIAG